MEQSQAHGVAATARTSFAREPLLRRSETAAANEGHAVEGWATRRFTRSRPPGDDVMIDVDMLLANAGCRRKSLVVRQNLSSRGLGWPSRTTLWT